MRFREFDKSRDEAAREKNPPGKRARLKTEEKRVRESVVIFTAASLPIRAYDDLTGISRPSDLKTTGGARTLEMGE